MVSHVWQALNVRIINEESLLSQRDESPNSLVEAADQNPESSEKLTLQESYVSGGDSKLSSNNTLSKIGNLFSDFDLKLIGI